MNSLKQQTLPLLRPPHVIYFAACCFMHFGTFCIAGGMGLFMPQVLNQVSNARLHDSGDLRICQAIQFNLSSNSSAIVDGVS